MQTNVREEFRRKKKQGWVLKLDLEKAYDRTDWDFLDYVLARKGFDPSWRKWTIGCLPSSQFSIIINDTPTTRGLRQGDLLSPFSFTLFADIFSQIILKGEKKKLFSGFRVGSEEVRVSHLQLADDTLIFMEEGSNSINNLFFFLIDKGKLLIEKRKKWEYQGAISRGRRNVLGLLMKEATGYIE